MRFVNVVNCPDEQHLLIDACIVSHHAHRQCPAKSTPLVLPGCVLGDRQRPGEQLMTTFVGGCLIDELRYGDACGVGATHQGLSGVLDPAVSHPPDRRKRERQRNRSEPCCDRTGIDTSDTGHARKGAMTAWVANSRSAASWALVGPPSAAVSSSMRRCYRSLTVSMGSLCYSGLHRA